MSGRRYDESERVDPAGEAIHCDLGCSLSYGEYLQLDRILGVQQPLSHEHDEMMFIIVPQTSSARQRW